MHERGGVPQLDKYRLCYCDASHTDTGFWLTQISNQAQCHLWQTISCEKTFCMQRMHYFIGRLNGRISDRAEIRTPNFQLQYLSAPALLKEPHN